MTWRPVSEQIEVFKVVGYIPMSKEMRRDLGLVQPWEDPDPNPMPRFHLFRR